MADAEAIRSDIPARLDRLWWSPWHWRVVLALGIAWILDGLEVTLVGALGAMLTRADTLALSAAEVGWAGSLYVAGAVIGALAFGRLADRLGRKRLFLLTLAVYLAATLATAFSAGFASFGICRFVTGLGIGGEYAAINSAIDELIPARVRGRVNLALNGSFWIGAMLGAALSILLLDTRWFAPGLGWRVAFGLGALLAFAIALVRRHVPESPRWLMVQGRHEEAERVVTAIEAEVARACGPLRAPLGSITISRRPPPSLIDIAQAMLTRYPQRSLLGFALMIAQAFFYNAIFFTYALVLTRFYGVAEQAVGFYIFPFALGNVLGPFVLGPLFDLVGRRRMIAATYALSGLGLGATAVLFLAGRLDATTQTWCWSAVFFFASAAASSAYLSVSELFPLEIRALAISLFYALGTGAGGFVAPALFGALVASGSRAAVCAGYGLGAALMLAAAAVALIWGVNAEGKALEDIAAPLSAVENAGSTPSP